MSVMRFPDRFSSLREGRLRSTRSPWSCVRVWPACRAVSRVSVPSSSSPASPTCTETQPRFPMCSHVITASAKRVIEPAGGQNCYAAKLAASMPYGAPSKAPKDAHRAICDVERS